MAADTRFWCQSFSKERESKTWLSEQDGPITSLDMLMARCTYFSLSKAEALAVLADVYAAVLDWRRVALSTEVGLHSNELEDFAPAFEHDQMDEAQILLTWNAWYVYIQCLLALIS